MEQSKINCCKLNRREEVYIIMIIISTRNFVRKMYFKTWLIILVNDSNWDLYN